MNVTIVGGWNVETMALDAHKDVWIRHLQKGRDPTCIRWIEEAVDDEIHYVCLREEESCCILELDTKTKQASLSFLGKGRETKGLVLAAVAVAHERGILHIEILDKSPQCDRAFLTTGRTWYESILPLESMSDLPIEEFRRRVTTNTWNDVSNLMTRMGSTQVFDTSGIDIHASGSAMAVLRRTTEIQNMMLLLLCSGVTSLYEERWKVSRNYTAGTLVRSVVQEQEQDWLQEQGPA